VLEDRYLLLGLDALSRAHETDYFADGHRGAAIIAAYYFCREVDVEDGVADVICAMLDEHWTHTGLCAPLPREAPESGGIARVVESVEKSMSGLRQAGHNVILPSLALKAFRQLPEAITPSRIEGICKLVESFTTAEDLRLEGEDEIADLAAPPAAAAFILSELLRTIQAFDGRGQGWSGHLLTYGRALLDLRLLGYGSMAQKGEHAFKLYIKRIRTGPLDTDKPRHEHPPSELLPHQLAYWKTQRALPVGIGHVFKYPYAYYGWLGHLQDSDLAAACMRAAYHIF
jgi:hypothetical protein